MWEVWTTFVPRMIRAKEILCWEGSQCVANLARLMLFCSTVLYMYFALLDGTGKETTAYLADLLEKVRLGDLLESIRRREPSDNVEARRRVLSGNVLHTRAGWGAQGLYTRVVCGWNRPVASVVARFNTRSGCVR